MAPRRSVPQRFSDSFRVISQLDLSHRYEAQAGLIALVVGAAVLLAVLLVSGWRLGGGGLVNVTARFRTVAGLNGGNPVQISGVTVGRVRAVELLPSGDVLVRFRVEPRVRPRRDAYARIVGLTLASGQALDYFPGVLEEPLPADDVLVGRVAPGLQSALAATAERGAELAVTGLAFTSEDLQRDVAAARAATARARSVLGAVRGDSVAGATADLVRAAQGALDRLDSVMAAVAAAQMGRRLEQVATDARGLAGAVDTARAALAGIQRQLAGGQGTLGGLTRDSAFRNELAATRRSLDLLQAKYLGRRPPPPPR